MLHRDVWFKTSFFIIIFALNVELERWNNCASICGGYDIHVFNE